MNAVKSILHSSATIFENNGMYLHVFPQHMTFVRLLIPNLFIPLYHVI